MIKVYQGHVLKWLKMLPAGLFHTCITSPPYWGLRSYPGYSLEWPPVTFRPMAGLAEVEVPAWTGCLGLEEIPLMYVAHIVLIWRELWRVLRNDGTCFLNLGSSYVANKTGSLGYNNNFGHSATLARPNKRAPGFKQKDIVPIPWMVAMALQADGWYLRSSIIWGKGLSFATHQTKCPSCGRKHEARYSGSCMPESCRDRPTKSHEYVFLLSKSPRYYWDIEAVRESASPSTKERDKYERAHPRSWHTDDMPISGGNRDDGAIRESSGRNIRTVWAIDDTLTELVKFGLSQGMNIAPLVNAYLAAQGDVKSVFVINPASFPGSHFATFSPALVSPMIRASTSERGVCPNCQAPWERVTEKETVREIARRKGHDPKLTPKYAALGVYDSNKAGCFVAGNQQKTPNVTTTGWQPTCTCNAGEPVPATVADVFAGAFTTNLVAERLGRDSVAFELSPEYVEMGTDRVFDDAPLFTKIEVIYGTE